MKARLFLLAPLLLFLGGCAVSAEGADVPQIDDIDVESTPELVVARDPVDLARELIAQVFSDSEVGSAATDIVVAEGSLVVVLDRLASTLSSAELFMRYCRAVASVVASDHTTVPVTSASVVDPAGRTIAAVTAESAECFYR